MKKLLGIVSLFLSITSCTAFYPEVSRHQHYQEDCKLVTKSLELSHNSSDLYLANNDTYCDINCLATLLIIPAGTFIISESIVLTNNTLHWIEYESRCKSELGQSIKRNEKKAIEPINESCLLECDLLSTKCHCLEKNSALRPQQIIQTEKAQSTQPTTSTE